MKNKLILVLFFLPATLLAQEIGVDHEKNWSASAAGYYYFIQNEKTYPTLIGTADINALHIEARYNYEDINTASLFGGWTWEKNGKLSLSFTPIIGFSVGNTMGFLPGLECSASYSKLNFYSENEYMLDFTGKENYFFYSWTQLSANILKNMQVGVLAESLRFYRTKFDVQRGVYAELSVGNFTFDLYYFNAFTDYDFAMLSLTFEF